MEAETTGRPYGRRKEKRPGSWPERRYTGETYYERPTLKASHYRWAVISYLFVGGIAGAAQLLATIADLTGRGRNQPIVRAGRYTAFVGSIISPILLIVDLGTPSRFYNMLRIFRPTSAMSIGAWTLFSFGSLSGLTAAAQFLNDVLHIRIGGALAQLFGIPAGVMGMLMSVYTGTLLSATSVPLWAKASPLLAPLFGTSAAATGSSAMSLILRILRAPNHVVRRLELFGLIASLAELILTILTFRRVARAGVAGPLQEKRLRVASRVGVLGVGVIAPIVGHALSLVTRREIPGVAVLAAAATLLGGYVQRAVVVFAGNESARRPRDYFQITQNGHTPNNLKSREDS